MSASLRQQFDAAVKLIRGLPKSGPFQPSNEMRLRLYGYYKQAVEGVCHQPAPGFWDVVGKAKWNSWKQLGDMSEQEAMVSYVNEIKQVIETMSLTDDVTAMMDTIGPLYEFVESESAEVTSLSAPGSSPSSVTNQLRSARKQHRDRHVRFSDDVAARGYPELNGGLSGLNGGLSEVNGGQDHVTAADDPRTGVVDAVVKKTMVRGGGVDSFPVIKPASSSAAAAASGAGGLALSDTDEDEEFNDTLEEPYQHGPILCNGVASNGAHADSNSDRIHSIQHKVDAILSMVDRPLSQAKNGSDSCGVDSTDGSADSRTTAGCAQCCSTHLELISLARELRDDMKLVSSRLDLLQNRLQLFQTQTNQVTQQSGGIRGSTWWRLSKLTPLQSTLLLMVVWPTLVHALMLIARAFVTRRHRQS